MTTPPRGGTGGQGSRPRAAGRGAPRVRIDLVLVLVLPVLWAHGARAQAPVRPNGPGLALRFDGVDDHLAATPPALPTGGSHYTIEAWIRTAAMNDGTIVSWGDFGVENGVNALRLTPTGLVNYWWANDLAVTTADLSGAWHHVAATHDGTSRRILLDGEVVWRDFPEGHDAGGGTLRIAAGNGNEHFQGEMDEVRIWSIGRSALEIRADMRRQLEGTEAGLVAYYRFDEPAGPFADDAGGSPANRAAFSGSPRRVKSTLAPFAPTVDQGYVLESATAVTLRGFVQPNGAPATAILEWGETPSHGGSTPIADVGGGSSFTSWSHRVTGLKPDTVYHFRAVATNSHGTSFGRGGTFTTGAPTCTGASGTRSHRNVVLRFNRPMARASAEDIFGYSVSDRDVVDARLSADGLSVVLTVAPPLVPGELFAVTASDLADEGGHALVPSRCTHTFQAFVLERGIAFQEIYGGIGGNAVDDLRAAASFPGNPSSSRVARSIEANRADEGDGYGTRISGLFVPAVTGPHEFFISSDDGGEFWLSLDDAPDNLQLVCLEPVYGARRDWLGTDRRNPLAPENRSSTWFPGGMPLVAGANYYFEALMKEGNGGDHLAVALRRPGDPLPASGSSPIGSPNLADYADPAAGDAAFFRGDANDDGVVDLSDAVKILNFLFLGSSAPACADAADSNDDGGLDLSDAVTILNALFSGGSSIAPPYPARGSDPTADGLPACGT